MRDAVPLPADIKYASAPLPPPTARTWTPSAPGTPPARHVAPPSVVTTSAPPTPLAQATRGLTGLIACSRFVVPLCCGVSVGAEAAELATRAVRGAAARVGAEVSEQHRVVAATTPVAATAAGRVRSMVMSPAGVRSQGPGHRISPRVRCPQGGASGPCVAARAVGRFRSDERRRTRAALDPAARPGGPRQPDGLQRRRPP